MTGSNQHQQHNIGIQLFTLRDRTATDFAGTLREVSKLGYSGVEFAGFGGMEAKELASLLDGLGLRGVSAHIGLAELSKVEEVAAFGHEIGLKYVVCPWLAPQDREPFSKYEVLAARLAQLGDQYARHGLSLCYHNHDFEFTTEDGHGQTAHDYLFKATASAQMQAELDVYWVERTGRSATEWISRFKGRCPLIHLKDMTADERRTFAELGSGTLPIPAIIEAGDACGADWYFVEQDICPGDSLDSARISIEYLRSLGVAGPAR